MTIRPLPAALFAIAYLLGSISFATILVRLFRGVDVRGHGSRSAGATNVLRTSGLKLALATLVLDFGKGLLAVFLMSLVTPSELWLGAAGVGAVLGHILPVWFGFRGGKGVATAAGAFALLAPWALLASFFVFVVTVGATRIVSVGSMLAALALPLAVRVLHGGPATIAAAAGTAGALLFAHRTNLKRLWNRSERGFMSRAGEGR